MKATRRERLHRRGVRLEWFTVAWNVVEGVVAIGAGLLTGSRSLVSFQPRSAFANRALGADLRRPSEN